MSRDTADGASPNLKRQYGVGSVDKSDRQMSNISSVVTAHRCTQVGRSVGPPASDAREAEGMVTGQKAKAAVGWVGLRQNALEADAALNLSTEVKRLSTVGLEISK